MRGLRFTMRKTPKGAKRSKRYRWDQKKEILRLEVGHILLVQHKGIVAMHEYELREVPHEWLCLHVEVPEHIIAAP